MILAKLMALLWAGTPRRRRRGLKRVTLLNKLHNAVIGSSWTASGFFSSCFPRRLSHSALSQAPTGLSGVVYHLISALGANHQIWLLRQSV
jgi:hypothetical protein